MKLFWAVLVSVSLVVTTFGSASADNSKATPIVPRVELSMPVSVQPGQTVEVPVVVRTAGVAVDVGEFLLVYPVDAIESVTFKAADGITTITQPRREDEGLGKFYLAYGVLGGTLKDGQRVATIKVALKNSLPATTITLQLQRNNLAHAGMPISQAPDTTYTISVRQLLLGDANGDGVVDLIDFSIMLGSFGVCKGQTAYNPQADFSRSGCVNTEDFSLLRSNFGRKQA
ncbi:MAG: hypothetical protein HYU80_04630 [Candidatus Blackburnbacteria bacterium]|nr:hypothetical protein [Candidatus Blackburnbacteria bacterium]